MSRAIQKSLVAGGVFLIALPGRGDAASPGPLRLFYLEPAREWTEALPVGNGRVGGMVFGGVAEERIALNEDTFWSGGPYDPTHDDALRHLPEVSRLIRDGRYQEAVHDLATRAGEERVLDEW